jgi:hypothetical protein
MVIFQSYRCVTFTNVCTLISFSRRLIITELKGHCGVLRLQDERTGNGATNLDDREGARGEDEEGWEEEYVMLDLDDVFHGAPVPNFAYTLSVSNTLETTISFKLSVGCITIRFSVASLPHCDKL